MRSRHSSRRGVKQVRQTKSIKDINTPEYVAQCASKVQILRYYRDKTPKVGNDPKYPIRTCSELSPYTETENIDQVNVRY